MDGRVLVSRLAVVWLTAVSGEGAGGGASNDGLFIPDINEDCRKRDLERIFSKYGPLKEIWLATYAPFYAFINYESKSDMEVESRVNCSFWLLVSFQYACQRTDGEKIAGKRIRVSKAKPRKSGPRRRRYSSDRRFGPDGDWMELTFHHFR